MVIRLRACLLAAGTIAAALAALASAAFGAENNIIRIGALLPMSGPGSYFGAQDRQGIELALDAINKTSVSGYKFEIKFELVSADAGLVDRVKRKLDALPVLRAEIRSR